MASTQETAILAGGCFGECRIFFAVTPACSLRGLDIRAVMQQMGPNLFLSAR